MSEDLYPYGRPAHLAEICAECGGERGLHNNMNQRCPKDPNASRDHTEYRETVFKSWKTDFTYFLEHLITHDKEKINLIVAEVERIAGSKFSLENMLDCWQDGRRVGSLGMTLHFDKQEREEYFFEKFGIDLTSPDK